jgi:Na+-transporting NADH:ubiquinone oxidoreductase subunit F
LHVITINDVRRVHAETGRTLLAALADHKIFVPSICGGRAMCGRCRVKVLEGGGPVGAKEEAKLGAAELAAGMRLACQVRIVGDMSISIPHEFLKTRDYLARCSDIRDLAGDIKQVRLELVEPKTMDYVSGQYVQVKVPIYNGNEEVQRVYSIASDPAEQGVLEFIIRRAPNGISTTWIFDHLKRGDEVRFNGPHGDFCLSGSDVPMVFVAGSSGMAPIRSMLYHMKNKGIKRKATLYFGVNLVADLFHADEMKMFESELADFRFVPVVAWPQADNGWTGEKGLVTDAILRTLSGADGMEGYLCGSQGLIDASIKVLTGLGMPEERIFYDKFV